MGGKHQYGPHEFPSEEYRTWRLCTILHCRPSELENESAVTLDWLIAVDDTVTKLRRQEEEERWKA